MAVRFDFKDGVSSDFFNENSSSLDYDSKRISKNRWARSELTFRFDKFSNINVAEHRHYEFEAPFDFEIEYISVSVESADAETYSANVTSTTGTVRTMSPSVVGSGSSAYSEAIESFNQFFTVGDKLNIDPSCSGVTYDAGVLQVNIYIKVDVLDSSPPTGLVLSGSVVEQTPLFGVSRVNTFFSSHETYLAGLNKSVASNSLFEVHCPLIISVEPLAGAMVLGDWELPLPYHRTGWLLDDIDVYVEGTGSVTFDLLRGGVIQSTATVAGTGINTTAKGTMGGLGETDDAAGHALSISGGTVVYRAYAVLYFRTDKEQ